MTVTCHNPRISKSHYPAQRYFILFIFSFFCKRSDKILQLFQSKQSSDRMRPKLLIGKITLSSIFSWNILKCESLFRLYHRLPPDTVSVNLNVISKLKTIRCIAFHNRSDHTADSNNNYPTNWFLKYIVFLNQIKDALDNIIYTLLRCVLCRSWFSVKEKLATLDNHLFLNIIF